MPFSTVFNGYELICLGHCFKSRWMGDLFLNHNKGFWMTKDILRSKYRGGVDRTSPLILSRASWFEKLTCGWVGSQVQDAVLKKWGETSFTFVLLLYSFLLIIKANCIEILGPPSNIHFICLCLRNFICFCQH